MNTIKKGDDVIVIAGKDKGRRGTVLNVNIELDQVLVEGVNVVKKHQKPNPNAGQPPAGLLSPEQNAWFQGPQTPQAVIGACLPYMIRQQVGQFLYVLDRSRNELVIFNSNNMRVIERIEIPDPTSMAMSPKEVTFARE